MPKCGGCEDPLTAVGAATCSLCPTIYHKGCVGLREKAKIAKDWVCPSCKQGVRKGDNSQTPVKSIGEPSSSTLLPSGKTGTGAASAVLPLPSNKASDIEISNFQREFADGMTEMREFRNEMRLLRESITAMSERLNSVDYRLDGMERRIEALESREPGDGPGLAPELERTIATLKLELNERDQEALLADLDIGHVPEEKGENVMHTVTVLAAQLGVALDERDVVFAERVGVPPAEGGRARRIMVRLTRRHLRDEVLRAARVRRTVKSSQGGRVYVNERLTRSNRALFNQVRAECRRLNWRYSWTKQGRIFARHSDGKPVVRFRSEEDLARVFGAQSS